MPGNQEEDTKISDSISFLTSSRKRKHDEDDKEVESTDELILLDGISVPKDGSKIKSKKRKESLSEEKLLKLKKEKVLNILLLGIK